MNLDFQLARAKRIEDAIREKALLPVNDEINGIEVRQFNLEHWLILSKVSSPFLFQDRLVTPVDVGLFLWIVSPHYDPRSFGTAWGLLARIKRYFATRKRRLFLRMVVRQPHWINFEPRIRKYLKRAFMDRPASSSDGKAISAGLGASMIHRIAYVYKWSREEIRQMPLAEAFQYLNWNAAHLPQFNSVQDAVKNRLMNRLNPPAMNGAARG